jgi:hypothetical protein
MAADNVAFHIKQPSQLFITPFVGQGTKRNGELLQQCSYLL